MAPADVLPVEAPYLAGLFLSLALGTFAHEFGHALAAWSVGTPPRLISIGVAGRIVARLKMSSATVVVRAVPIGGFTYTLVTPATTRRQRAVTIVGGPSANVLLMAGAVAIWATLNPPGGAGDLLAGWLLGQALILANSVIPYERKTDGHTSTTDAMRLWRLTRMRPQDMFRAPHEALLRRHLPDGAEPPAPSSHFPEIAFQRLRRDRKRDAWAQDGVHASISAILQQPELPDAERSLAAELLHTNELHRQVRAMKAELAALRRGRAGTHARAQTEDKA